MDVFVKHHKTLFSKNDYVVGLYLRIGDNEKSFITCKGYGLPKNNSCFYKFGGEFVEDKGKKVFVVNNSQIAITKSKAGIKSFFKADYFKGISTSITDKMVDKYDIDIFKIIKYTPDKLLSFKGMDTVKLETLKDGYAKATSYSEITKLLSPMGIASRVIRAINDEYGGRALNIIMHEPFELISIKGIGFRTCDTIARYLNIALNSPKRIQCGVYESLREMSSSGDTYEIDSEVVRYSLDKLNEGLDHPVVKEIDIVNEICTMIQNKKIYVEHSSNMFLDRFHDSEELITKAIKNYFLKLPVEKAEQMCAEAEKYNEVVLSNKQLAAVKTSLSSSISVITGSAGTGKTSVTRAIIYAYKKMHPDKDVTLLAPTGKAARRMSEVTGQEAYTIHARLGLYEGVEEPNDFINGGLIIVDEFSMVDTLLFANLLKAISGTSQLVIIGDSNQLQSVGAGACLKDIVDSGVVPVSRLTEIFRQEGKNIVNNSIKVIQNNNALEFGDDFIFVQANNEDSAIKEILKIYKYYVNKVGIENVAVLTPLRNSQERFKCVSDELNSIIQKEINTSSVRYIYDGKEFRLRDRVMMWKNTPIASNGDIGTIISLDTNNSDWDMEMKVLWENGNTGVYHKNNLADITLAYTMTVHKSQGSEYDVIIMPVLSEQKCKMFRNNLFYTSITRAKKNCILVGDRNAIKTMISQSETSRRKTMLKEDLLKDK